jgi:hypothetical protein
MRVYPIIVENLTLQYDVLFIAQTRKYCIYICDQHN